jgi:hypothetical protein
LKKTTKIKSRLSEYLSRRSNHSTPANWSSYDAWIQIPVELLAAVMF